MKKKRTRRIGKVKGLNSEKLDDAVLAMLSLCILSGRGVPKLGIQADPHFDHEALERLHSKGHLAAPPNILPDRPVWLSPKGVRRAKALFRALFCDKQ